MRIYGLFRVCVRGVRHAAYATEISDATEIRCTVLLRARALDNVIHSGCGLLG